MPGRSGQSDELRSNLPGQHLWLCGCTPRHLTPSSIAPRRAATSRAVTACCVPSRRGLDRPAARDRRQPPATQLASLRPCRRRTHRGDHRQGGRAPHGALGGTWERRWAVGSGGDTAFWSKRSLKWKRPPKIESMYLYVFVDILG